MTGRITKLLRLHLQDLLIAGLVVWYIAIWLSKGGGPDGKNIILAITSYTCLYVGLRVLSFLLDDKDERLVLATLCVMCMAESAFGLLQVFGARPSGNAWFAITGHFRNPGPFGGYIACLMAPATAYLVSCKDNKMLLRILAGGAIFSGLLVLPASMSRSAWVGYAIAIIPFVYKREDVKAYFKHKQWVIPSVSLSVALIIPAVFLLKKESALGRIHIWMMDAKAALSHPLMGCGPGMRMGLYGDIQQEWFRAHPAMLNSWHSRVAGCPEYAFNDFLGIGMDCGLPALILGIAIVAVCIRNLGERLSPMAAGMTCWSIFALASYPLSIPQLCILPVLFLALSGGSHACKTQSRSMERILIIASALSFLLSFAIIENHRQNTYGKERFRDLYDTGYALFQEEEYTQSIEVLEQGQRISSDPMFLIIKGRCLESMGEVDKAEKEYLSAHYRVPCRIYPIVRLMRLKLSLGKEADALDYARKAARMPVNPRHFSMQQLHDESVAVIDSLVAHQ